MIDAIFSPEALAEIRAYKDPLYSLRLIYEGLNLLLWVLILRFGVGRLYDWSGRMTARLDRGFLRLRSTPVVRVIPSVLDRVWGGPGWGMALVFLLVLDQANNFVFLPLDFYFGFIHEQKFGMSTESLGSYWWDWAKAAVISMVAVSALAFGMLGLARRLPSWWLIIGAVGAIVLIFSAALDPYRAKVYFDQTPLPEGEVREAITAVMRKAEIDFQDVVIEKTLEKTVRVQAYFAGKGPTRKIVLNDALLKELNTAEIVAVVSHEAAHVHEPRWLGQLGSTLALLGFLFLIERLFQLVAKRGWWGVKERADVRVLPLVFTVFWLASIGFSPISAGFSRQRELEADQFALRLTGDVPAFRQMLTKLARINKMDPDPPRWIVLRSWTHPPIRERLAAIQ